MAAFDAMHPSSDSLLFYDEGCLETHNEHSASMLRALPLGMRLRNVAYSEQACPSPLKSLLKCCKSAVRQESPAQSASDKIQIRPVFKGSLGFEITILDLVSDSAVANIPAHDV